MGIWNNDYLQEMSIKDLKRHIAQLSPAEQDDLRQYIDMLQSNETVLDPLPDHIWTEIEYRATALLNGKMKSAPAHEVVTRLRERMSKELYDYHSRRS